MSNNITLWDPQPTAASADDESGAIRLKYTCPSPPHRPPYEAATEARATKRLLYVPSLQSLCIRALADFPELVHILHPTRLLYKSPNTRQEHDIIRELIHDPSATHPADDETDLDVHLTDRVDPRLWAVLVQVYTRLPDRLRTYIIPLEDPWLPLLQQIPCTDYFAMATVVELPQCAELTDNTIVRLRLLHNLAYLDISSSRISSRGIKLLSKTLKQDEGCEFSDMKRFRGPWMLRILSARDCTKVDDSVFDDLRRFPLLSVLDLRGTRCTPAAYKATAFLPSGNAQLFCPTPAIKALKYLNEVSQAFPGDGLTFLHIKSQRHTLPSTRRHLSSIPACRDVRDIHSFEPALPLSATAESWLGHPQDYIAEYEAQRASSSAEATAFYGSASSASGTPIRDLRRQTPPPEVIPPLMLWRSPPPWHALLHSSEANQRPPKRPRTTAGDTTILSVAKPNDAAVNSLVNRPRASVRMSISEFEKERREKTKKKAVSTNPFRRNVQMPTSVFGEHAKKAEASSSSATLLSNPPLLGSGSKRPKRRELPVETDAHAPSPRTINLNTKRKIPITGPKDMNENNGSDIDDCPSSPQMLSAVLPSKLPLPKHTIKPLRPISTLPIPKFPPGSIPLIPPARDKHPSFSSSSSSAGRQLELSQFVKRATVAVRTGPRNPTVRGSSVTTTKRAEGKEKEDLVTQSGRVAAVATRRKSTAVPAKPGSMGEAARRKSASVTKFDWKGWGGGKPIG